LDGTSDADVVPARYADGPTVEVEVFVHTSPGRLWPLVSDIDLPGRFSDEFVGAEWLDGITTPAPGARFRGHNRHRAIGEWDTVSIVTECDPPRVFAWAVTSVENPASTWRFELEPRAGGTVLRQKARLGPGPSGTLVEIEYHPDEEEKIIQRRLSEHRVNMQRTIDGIRALGEGTDPPKG
jgi:hypothetical protein